jgi:hypothetical protein
MINAEQRRYLQALDITVWLPINSQASVPTYRLLIAPASASVLLLIKQCHESKLSMLMNLLKNILRYLQLNEESCAIAMLSSEQSESALDEAALSARFHPQILINFGVESSQLTADKQCHTLDVNQLLVSPLQKRQVMEDLSALSL